jgi:hypothetical protein
MKILDIPRSGSYAGITSSRNRFGQYVRNRRSPVQPVGTGRRAFIRNAFGAASAAWAALNVDAQAAWDAFAESHPVVNSLGASVVLTGHQMYVAVQTQRTNVGLDASTLPPESTATPAISDITFVPDDAPTVSLNVTADAVPGFLLSAYTPPLSAGRRFPPRFWQASSTALVEGSQALDDSTKYVAEFGTMVIGTRIFARLTPVNSEGWTGTPTIISAVVVEAV